MIIFSTHSNLSYWFLKSLSNVVLNFQHDGIRVGTIPFWLSPTSPPSLATAGRQPSPSAATPATTFSGKSRVECASRSATHPYKSLGQNPSHAPPRAAASSRQSRCVKATRCLPAVGTSPDHLQSLHRPVLGTIQPLFFNFNHLERVYHVLPPFFSLLGFRLFGQKWLLPALCTQF